MTEGIKMAGEGHVFMREEQSDNGVPQKQTAREKRNRNWLN